MVRVSIKCKRIDAPSAHCRFRLDTDAPTHHTTLMTTTNSTCEFALVNSDSKITSLHETRADANNSGWGWMRELVILTRPHSVGDSIEYDERGVEI